MDRERHHWMPGRRAVHVLKRQTLVGLTLCSVIVGCQSRPARVQAPSWNPQRMAARVMEQLDANGDSFIDTDEAKQAPGLAAAFHRIDADGDGRLTEEEIRDRFALYKKLGTGLTSQSFQVLVNGRPVPDAQVEFIPEEFQEGVLQPASGSTDRAGHVVPQTEGQDFPAMQVGFYRVKVSVGHGSEAKVLDSKEPLGVEVSPVSEEDDAESSVLNVVI